MTNVPCSRLSAALLLLLWSCSDDLVVGEIRCFGAEVVCDSDAETFVAKLEPGSPPIFDLEPSRHVAPTWVYDYPADSAAAVWTQLAPAPGGGVWAVSYQSTIELQRINAEGEPVELHALTEPAALSVDEELSPVLLSWSDGYIRQATVTQLGEMVSWTVGYLPTRSARTLLIGGSQGHVRVGVFEPHGSYVADYEPLGDLVWRQSEVRDARDFPFERLGAGMVPAASYRMIGLRDGAIAVGVPKRGRSDQSSGLGASPPERAQGITLIGPDGNLRWDRIMGQASVSMLLAPGLDGSVVYATSFEIASGQATNAVDSMSTCVIDREGTVAACWVGQRSGYHDAMPRALCTDPEGAIYVVMVTGERKAPLPTVCRMNVSAPDEKVVCLGVEDVLLPWGNWVSEPTISAATAPEPGAVVLSVGQWDVENQLTISRLVRVDF